MYDLSKYRWADACRFFEGFREAPGVLRLAWELADRYNEELKCAWPSRETLSQRLGAPPESISRWIKKLCSVGAITCMPLKKLPPEIRAEIGRSSGRSQVYILNFGWALDVLNLRDERMAARQADLLKRDD
jgi:hypothetical protein